jgi:MFS family permease
MRSIAGLLWALGGAAAGLATGVVGAMIFSGVTNMTDREGARGYFVIAIGLLCAILGLVLGIVMYGRSAPSGERAAAAGSGVLGVVGLIAAMAVAIYAFLQLQEKPLEYNGAMANLELEFRTKSANVPDSNRKRWLNIEVQTSKTRPEALLMWDKVRTDGEYTIMPAVQGPLYRAGSRFIVVRIGETQTEMFSPPMKRTPDPNADWSEWYAPNSVDAPVGVTPIAPLAPLLEVRYRVRVYGS